MPSDRSTVAAEFISMISSPSYSHPLKQISVESLARFFDSDAVNVRELEAMLMEPKNCTKLLNAMHEHDGSLPSGKNMHAKVELMKALQDFSKKTQSKAQKVKEYEQARSMVPAPRSKQQQQQQKPAATGGGSAAGATAEDGWFFEEAVGLGADDDDDVAFEMMTPASGTTGRSRYYMTPSEEMEAYRKGHPEIEDNPKLSQNLDFYRGATAMRPYDCYIHDFHEGMGENLAELMAEPEEGDGTEEEESKYPWYGNYEKLEREHSFIQHLFPLQEGKGLSHTSQPLQKHEIKWMTQDPAIRVRIVKSYCLMLDFYGMRLVNSQGLVERMTDSDKRGERYRNLNWSSHNYLRITRILKCLGDMDLENLKIGWLRFLIEEIMTKKCLPNAKTSLKSYWVETVRDEAIRKQFKEACETPQEEPAGSATSGAAPAATASSAAPTSSGGEDEMGNVKTVNTYAPVNGNSDSDNDSNDDAEADAYRSMLSPEEWLNIARGKDTLFLYRNNHPELLEDQYENSNLYLDLYRGARREPTTKLYIDDIQEGVATSGYYDDYDDEYGPDASDYPMFQNYEYLEMETSGWMKSLFPLEDDPILDRKDALQKHEIKWMKKDAAIKERVIRSFKLVADMWGFEVVDDESGEMQRVSNVGRAVRRFKYLCDKPIRVVMFMERVLSFLGTMGLTQFQIGFIEVLMDELESPQSVLKEYRLHLTTFVETIKDDTVRERLDTVAQSVIRVGRSGMYDSDDNDYDVDTERASYTSSTDRVGYDDADGYDYQQHEYSY